MSVTQDKIYSIDTKYLFNSHKLVNNSLSAVFCIIKSSYEAATMILCISDQKTSPLLHHYIEFKNFRSAHAYKPSPSSDKKDVMAKTGIKQQTI